MATYYNLEPVAPIETWNAVAPFLSSDATLRWSARNSGVWRDWLASVNCPALCDLMTRVETNEPFELRLRHQVNRRRPVGSLLSPDHCSASRRHETIWYGMAFQGPAALQLATEVRSIEGKAVNLDDTGTHDEDDILLLLEERPILSRFVTSMLVIAQVSCRFWVRARYS